MAKSPYRSTYLIRFWAPPSTYRTRPVTPVMRKAARTWGAQLDTVLVTGTARHLTPQKRWIIHLDDPDSAEHLGVALSVLHAFLYMPLGDERITLYPIPPRLIRRWRLNLESLIRKSAGPSFGLHLDLAMRFSISADATVRIWRFLPACVNERVLRALTFLDQSRGTICVSPGELHDLHRFGEIDDPPSNAANAARYETAFQNAYKAIEAIVGDPSKDDRKYHQQLRAAGLNPAELSGRGRGSPLAKKIRELSELRDKLAAHGSTPRTRRLTIGQVIECQMTASHVIAPVAISEVRRHGIEPRG